MEANKTKYANRLKNYSLMLESKVSDDSKEPMSVQTSFYTTFRIAPKVLAAQVSEATSWKENYRNKRINQCLSIFWDLISEKELNLAIQRFLDLDESSQELSQVEHLNKHSIKAGIADYVLRQAGY